MGKKTSICVTTVYALSLGAHELEWKLFKDTHTENAAHLIDHGVGDPKFGHGPDRPYPFGWASITTTATSAMPVTTLSTAWIDSAKTAGPPDQDRPSMAFKVLSSKALDKA